MLVDELVQKITIKADTKALDVVQKKEKQLVATTNTLGASFKTAFKWLGGGLLIKSVIDASVSMDSLNRSFTALAGSSSEGAKQIAFLRAEAMRLGQDFPTIAEAYKNFFAVGKGAGLATGETQGIFTSLLEASTVLGSSAQATEGALLAVEQMISKGKVSMEELRRQLGNALPGAFQIASKAMGVSSAEFEKLIAKGLPSLDFVRKFSAELRKNYSGDKLTGPVKSLRAELARLKNAWFFIRSDIMDGEAGKAFAEAIREITKLLMSEGFKKAIKLLSLALTFILKNFKMIATTFILGKFLKLITATKTLSLALTAISKSGALLTLTKSVKGLALAGWSATIPFAKLALMVVALHDLIVALFDKDLHDRATEFMEKHKWAQFLVPTYPIGKAVGVASAEAEKNPFKLNEWSGMAMGAGEADAMNAWLEQKIKERQAKQPQVVQNNYITTQNIDQNMLDERIKGQVRGMFMQTAQGGAK